MLIAAVLFLALIAAAAFTVFRDRRRQQRTARALGLDEPGVRVVDCEGPMFRFAVKWDEGNAYAVNDIGQAPIRIPLTEIAGCEFSDGGDRSRGVGASVGRFLVGGAAVDAMDEGLRGTVLRIYRKDPGSRTVEFRLKRSTYLEDFRRFAKEVTALVEEITEANEA